MLLLQLRMHVSNFNIQFASVRRFYSLKSRRVNDLNAHIGTCACRQFCSLRSGEHCMISMHYHVAH